MHAPPPTVPPPLGGGGLQPDPLERLRQLTMREAGGSPPPALPATPAPAPPPLPVMRPPVPPSPRRRRWLWTALTAVLLAVFIGTALAFRQRWQPVVWPEPRPGVRVLPSAPPVSSHALPRDSAPALLRSIRGAARALANVPAAERSRFRTDGIAEGSAALWTRALQTVSPHRPAWSRAARARWVYCEDESSDELAGWLAETVAMATLEAARAELEWVNGRTNVAWGALDDLFHIGRGLSAGGPLPEVIAGWAVSAQALRGARRLARRAPAVAEIDRLDQLVQSIPSSAATAALEGLRYEAAMVMNAAQQIHSLLWLGHPPVEGVRRLPRWLRAINRRLLVRFGSEPSATQRRIVAAMSLLIGAMEGAPEVERQYLELRHRLRAPGALFSDPVAVSVLRAFLPNLTALRQRVAEMDEELAATRWVLAVRRFALAEGRLPATLEEAATAIAHHGGPLPPARGFSLRTSGRAWVIAADSGRVYGLRDLAPER
ncbi:MAG: hypothetical protein N2652_09380 [Kiritimatiellae bacterium]|nr:hypothetical protein [Kiritimatiellia bacterium]